MHFFDSNAFVGRPVAGGYPETSVPDLLAALDRAGIEKSLVWHIAQFDGSPVDGNELVSRAVAQSARLVGCWAVLPPQTGEVITDDFFARMRSGGIAALRAFPQVHNYLLRRRVFGAFMDEVSRRRIPVLLSLEHDVSWPQVYDFLEDYPDITCLLCDIGIWGQDRFTWPLLESFPHVRIETSYLSLEAGGLEAAVRKHGASRIIFGSGFPKRYPEAAMLDLRHASISESDRRMIAADNLDTLINGAQL